MEMEAIQGLVLQLVELVELHLLYSKIERLWKGIKYLDKLKLIKLKDSLNLIATPDFTGVPNLEKLLDGLPEKLWNVESLKKLNVSGITLREPPSSVTLENLEELSLQGCMCSLKRLDLSNCNLQIIPNDFGNLSSIYDLNLSENHFSCLPESMVQLSKLGRIELNNCTRLRSLSQLPSTISNVEAGGCTSLETCPNGFKSPNSYTRLSLINCFKLVRQSDMFSYALRMLLTAHEEICEKSIGVYNDGGFNIVIPGREIPKWFTHQSVGDTVSAQVTHLNENKWIGIAMCAVPMAYPDSGIGLECEILSNGHSVGRFRWNVDGPGFHQVGFRLVYKQDMEDIREMLSAQSSNSTCITPYEGLDVHHNSTEGINLKRSRDEYEGDSNEKKVGHVSHSSLSHSPSAAPEVVASSGKTVCEDTYVRMHSPVDSHSSLSHSRSAALDVVASSGRTIVRESFYLHRRHFFIYTSPDCLFNIESKLSLAFDRNKSLHSLTSSTTSPPIYLLLDSFRIAGGTFFDICPKIACLTSRVHGTV
nr:disease resistance protein rml1b [Quercus suber]